MRMMHTLFAGAALAGAAAVASPALACGADVNKKIAWDAAPADPLAMPASFTPGTTALTAGAKPVNADFTPGSIVGLWNVTFYDDADNVVDFGYVAWHDDGTEIMNSGGRSPASENFCLGVYKQTGNRHYTLNHYALGYDPSTGNLAVKVSIVENVTVDATGDKYDGPFVQTVTDATSGKVLVKIKGMVVGTRLSVK